MHSYIYRSRFSVLHACNEFSQHHLLESLSPLLHVFNHIVKEQTAEHAWDYFCILFLLIHLSILVQYHAVFITIALWYTLKFNASACALWPSIPFAIKSVFWFFINFRIVSFYVKNVTDTLFRIPLNMPINFSSLAIFTTFFSAYPEPRNIFPFSDVLLYLLFQITVVLVTRPFTFWLQ